jgi:magnesium chelatase subunit D
MKSLPPDRPAALQEKIYSALRQVLGLDPSAPGEINPEDMAESIQVPGAAAAGSVLFSFLGKKHGEAVFEPDRTIAAAGIDVEDLLAKGGQGKRKAKATVVSPTGRYLRAERIQPGDRNYRIAVDATLRQAAMRSAHGGGTPEGGVPVKEGDFRKKRLVKPFKTLIVFVVDSSGSMGSGTRAPMEAAKGAVLAILRKASQSRSQVAMVAFGGQRATLVLPPTSSVAVAESALERLPAGGATPFSDSLSQAWQLIRSERLRNPSIRPILVIISDGEANVPISPGAEPLEELVSLAEEISRDRIPAVFIDAAAQKKGESEMRLIAGRMRASYIAMSDLSASSVLEAVLGYDGIRQIR